MPFRTRVWCEDADVTLYVRALDVSERGLCVRTPRPFDAGSTLRVGLSGPDGDAIAEARVAWSRPDRGTPAMGLELTKFESGPGVFTALVERARARAAAVHAPEPWGEDPLRDTRGTGSIGPQDP